MRTCNPPVTRHRTYLYTTTTTQDVCTSSSFGSLPFRRLRMYDVELLSLLHAHKDTCECIHFNSIQPYCTVLYSSIYIAPLNSNRQLEAPVVRLAPRKETSFKK